MTENTAVAEVTEAVEYDARQNRKYAGRKLRKAQSLLYGRSGLTATEKVQRLAEARELALKAVEALDKALVQAAAEAVNVPVKVVLLDNGTGGESDDEQAAENHVFAQAYAEGF